jgi:predicted DNA-binding transcriptional regulator AlpA
MQGEDKVDYRYTLTFPDAKAFACDDVLNFMVEVEFPRNLDLSDTADGNETREYLIERLLKSVIDGRFDLWDAGLSKVVAPPAKNTYPTPDLPQKLPKSTPVDGLRRFLNKTFTRSAEPGFIKALEGRSGSAPVISRSRRNYKEHFWWAKMTYILKPDLVKFCNGERIRVIFEDDVAQTTSQTTPLDASTELDSSINLNDSELQADNSPITQQPTESPPEMASVIEPAAKPKIIDETFRNFDKLPDSAYVDVKVVAALFDCSVPTVWRRVRAGQLVEPDHLGTRTTRWKVGEIKAALQLGKSRSK